MSTSRAWDELELPVLQWVHEHTWAQPGKLHHLGDERSVALPQFSEAQVDEALLRLREYGFIVGQRDEAQVVWWKNVRPTANGLRVLAEWPPVAAAAVNDTLARISAPSRATSMRMTQPQRAVLAARSRRCQAASSWTSSRTA